MSSYRRRDTCSRQAAIAASEGKAIVTDFCVWQRIEEAFMVVAVVKCLALGCTVSESVCTADQLAA